MSVEDEVLRIQKKLSKMSSPDGEVSNENYCLYVEFNVNLGASVLHLLGVAVADGFIMPCVLF